MTANTVQDHAMAAVSVADAKDRLPALLQAAERGEVTTITRYGRPVAELRAIDTSSAPPPLTGAAALAWLDAALARAGLPVEAEAVALVVAMREA
ncbi:hypothetical protein IP88_02190 [alpha proteobacterium AAP81b]|nr:hypothetical protein IP88_02190 [alpha proteobacterium AAP81b]